MHNRIRTSFFAVAAAVALSVSGAALAQPAGPHHGAPPGGDFVHAIAGLKSQLGLNTSQLTMWESAVAQSKSAGDAARANFDRMHTALTTELAKPEPDLAAVAAVSDDVHVANETLRKQVRASWLAIYATFTPEQKAVVKQALADRMSKMEQMKQKMMQRRGS